jgi:C4-dicarboxylate-specific signal transduction histidine kinase
MSDSSGGVFASGCDQGLTDAPAGLARATRVASLGEPAGSIIHEVTQPMTGIVASAELYLRWLAPELTEFRENRKFVKRIIGQGIGWATSLVRSPAHNGQLQFAELRPQAIEEVDRSTPGIKAGGAHLQEVILHLVPNAIDAMADVDGSARVITVSSNFVDGYTSVAIADTGVGVPQSSERVFGALYTTMDGGSVVVCRSAEKSSMPMEGSYGWRKTRIPA